ncbi:MASE4 domain-containing protein [Escherichia coli]|nr:MASE4 domain-containing protein [Escherichia coli]
MLFSSEPKQKKQKNLCFFIVWFFFLNLVVFIFLFLYFVSNPRQSYLLILSFAFLSNTYYLLEVAIISLSPIGNDLSTIYQKSNAIAIYYTFR